MRARSHGATSLTWIWCMTSSTILLVLHVKHRVRDNEYLREDTTRIVSTCFTTPRFPIFVWRHYFLLNLKNFCMNYSCEDFLLQVESCDVWILQPLSATVCFRGNYVPKTYFSDGPSVLHWDLQATWKLLQAWEYHSRKGGRPWRCGYACSVLHPSDQWGIHLHAHVEDSTMCLFSRDHLSPTLSFDYNFKFSSQEQQLQRIYRVTLHGGATLTTPLETYKNIPTDDLKKAVEEWRVEAVKATTPAVSSAPESTSAMEISTEAPPAKRRATWWIRSSTWRLRSSTQGLSTVYGANRL